MKLNISSDLSVDAELVLTERTCVIGQSGSGKSYTVAVICEELVKNNLGFCIIDTEGEYYELINPEIMENTPALRRSTSCYG